MASLNLLTPLHIAALKDRREAVSILLFAGADTEGKTDDQHTALHIAARKGHVAVVRILLASGADRTARRGDGASPLDLALQNGHLGVAALLQQETEPPQQTALDELETLKFLNRLGGAIP
mmetsp:Transcript_33364/g.48827  ORF Transcript_33364/g.48827 Transcript_33364/m.48827 type:complete len:121 (-) Transcript_33364:145-507(-)